MEGTEVTVAIAALVGLVLPMVITIVKQAGLPRWANLIIAIGSCIIAGTVTVWARGQLDWANWTVAVSAVITASQAAYAAYWRDSGIEGLNVITSLKK